MEIDPVIHEIFLENQKQLKKHHHLEFGIFPSADPESNYFNQVWTRDSAHAAGNYFAVVMPQAVIDSLRTIFKHQRADGALPLRVEREYQLVRLTPIIRRWSKGLFAFLEGRLRKRTERPVHEDHDAAGGEDTVPAVLIAAGALFAGSPEGREFIKETIGHLERAVEFFKKKTDPEDGLAIMTHDNPDWADTIKRKGKLGGINIWWAYGLHAMAGVMKEIGQEEKARAYEKEFLRVKQSIIEKLYQAQEGYFKAAVNDERLDTVASIFGALYFLSPEEAARVEETLKRRVERGSGLQNFDPPYPQKDIFWAHRWIGQWLYHNKFVWPWVTLQNIQVKVKIARSHPDEALRHLYRTQAVQDITKMAKLFKKAGGAYEVFEPDEPKAGRTRLYSPPKNFMGSMVAYQGAYAQLKELEWI